MELALRLKELAANMSVLYVEDEKTIREEMAEFLEKFFIAVDTARNGKEGLEIFKTRKQDIVITDILMPIMEGNDMMSEIRAISPKTPIIIISAYDFSDYVLPTNPNGANAFLKKPAAYADIVRTLCEVIESTGSDNSGIGTLQQHVKKLEHRVSELEDKVAKLELNA